MPFSIKYRYDVDSSYKTTKIKFIIIIKLVVMSVVIVKNGRVELRKDSGSLVRTIGNSGAVNASLNADQTLVLVTTNKGQVELRKESGSLIRTIVSSGAVNATFSGKDILVTKSNGRAELRKESGSLIRTL